MYGYKKVEVILSTYNGEKYLDEQLQSLINQDYPNLKIIVRDDGSKDSTIDILDKYKDNNKIIIYKGENLGVVDSFLALLKMTSKDVDYIAFCDQDDVWQKDKVSRAIELLQQEQFDIPLMYCSRLTIVDQDLDIIKYSDIPKKQISIENALVENIATGCSCVINKEARDRIIYKESKNIIMHDWWVYLVVSAFGKVVYDCESKILYRQHSNNVVGSNVNFIGKWKVRINRFIKNRNKRLVTKQAIEFKEVYKDYLSTYQQNILNDFINKPNDLIKRFKYSKNTPLFRQNRVDNIIFKLLITLNLI